MKFLTPSYYRTFRCIAEKCTDNCCIGWEIDIDPDTAAFYRCVGGDFGQRLQKNISPESTFILQKERCPFLNGSNLCDIILHCGEEHLCQICRDHPRYFEWYGNTKEGGIGLSCEEGARLILTSDEVPITVSETDEDPEPIDEGLFDFLRSAREHIFAVLENDALSLREKLFCVLDFAQTVQNEIDGIAADEPCKPCHCADITAVTALFSAFEPIDDTWNLELRRLQCKTENSLQPLRKTEEKYILHLCRYFIWRYFLKGVFDAEILSKVKFCVVSPLVIRLLCAEQHDLAAWIEKSKLYSKEMEYSDENRELFYDLTYEKTCLATDLLKAFIAEVLA